MTLHPDFQALLNAMRDLEALLEQSGAEFWATKVGCAAAIVATSDAYGLTKLLSFFGGMGSLNDLVLYRDGSTLNAENEKLDKLRLKA